MYDVNDKGKRAMLAPYFKGIMYYNSKQLSRSIKAQGMDKSTLPIENADRLQPWSNCIYHQISGATINENLQVLCLPY